MQHFVGLDWASQNRAVCIIDERGAIVERFETAHDDAGLAKLCQRVLAKECVTLAIERPSGLLVDALLDAGITVVAIHPNIVKAARSRYHGAGKSDAGDAYIIADLLRTDGHRFRPLIPHAEEIKSLRMLVRLRKDLVRTRVGVANQLRSTLQAVFPGAATIFADVDSAISLAFLKQYPSEASAVKMTPAALQRFLSENAYCGRRSPQELLERLRSRPSAIVSEDVSETAAVAVRGLVDVLVPIVDQITAFTAKINARLSELSDARIIQSFPGSGGVTAAMILAKLGSDRARFQTSEQFASVAGVTPVTYASGKVRGVRSRWACDHELREALTCLADNSRKRSPWAAQLYQRARARGCDHPHAVRIVARAWSRVIWRCRRDQTTYDPLRHKATTPAATAGG